MCVCAIQYKLDNVLTRAESSAQGMSFLELGLARRESIGCSELSPMTPHKALFRDFKPNSEWVGVGEVAQQPS